MHLNIAVHPSENPTDSVLMNTDVLVPIDFDFSSVLVPHWGNNILYIPVHKTFHTQQLHSYNKFKIHSISTYCIPMFFVTIPSD